MTEASPTRPRPSPRFLLIAGILVVVAFLGGFGWQFLEARSARIDRDRLETELSFKDLANTLASAAIQAEYGSYEGARELMSRFFTGLQSNLDSAPAEARETLAGILDRRDAIITGLAQGEDATRTTLARLYVQYQAVFGGPSQALPLATPGDAAGPDTGMGSGAAAPDTSGG